jgi:hypothetical protein
LRDYTVRDPPQSNLCLYAQGNRMNAIEILRLIRSASTGRMYFDKRAFPGFRFAPSWAILDASLRDDRAHLTGWPVEKNQF